MEKPTLLFAVQGIVGRVQVDDDFPLSTAQTLHPKTQQQRLRPGGIHLHLVITSHARARQFQPVERRRRCHRFAARFIGCCRQEWIVAQRRVVVEIFVTQGQGQHPLGNQRLHRVLNALRIPAVAKAPRKFSGQAHGAIEVAQEQQPTVRSELPAIKTRDHLA